MFRVEMGQGASSLADLADRRCPRRRPVPHRARGEAVAPPASGSEDAPPFLLQIVQNGLFAPLTGLAVVQPFFLSLALGLFAGDAIAGEAQSGTLRYLLVRPVGADAARALEVRGHDRCSVCSCSASSPRALCSAGGAVFGFGPLPTLSGSSLSVAQASLRISPRGVTSCSRRRASRPWVFDLHAHRLRAGATSPP